MNTVSVQFGTKLPLAVCWLPPDAGLWTVPLFTDLFTCSFIHSLIHSIIPSHNMSHATLHSVKLLFAVQGEDSTGISPC